MSKAVLISIRPKWVELIASGRKTIEIRKTRPKLETPFKCYIYETRCFERVGNDNLNCVIGGNGRGMVIGKFVCDRIFTIQLTEEGYDFDCPKLTGLRYEEMSSYLDFEDGYGWHISDLVIYGKPKELTDFIRPSGGCCNEGKCRGCKFFDKGNGYNVEDDCLADFDTDKYSVVRRAPQSWCYIEEL